PSTQMRCTRACLAEVRTPGRGVLARACPTATATQLERGITYVFALRTNDTLPSDASPGQARWTAAPPAEADASAIRASTHARPRTARAYFRHGGHRQARDRTGDRADPGLHRGRREDRA